MRLRTLTILTGIALTAIQPALARDIRVAPSYRAPAYGYNAAYGAQGYGYGGFAQPFIQGDYIGAPFTSVPRPSHLVPTPWSYGTYGVPTVSGIAAPPVGAPTLTVIHAPGGRAGIRRGAGEDPADVRVVNVSVPRR
jgi:hypothetical protein